MTTFSSKGTMEPSTRLGRAYRRLRRLPRRKYERRLAARNWYDPSARSDDAPIIVGGCGRSGTTLFREILNRHPRIFCGPETSMFGLPFWPQNIASFWELDERELQREAKAAQNLVRFAETFYRRQASLAGKARWADKTPNNVRAIDRILTWFPNARFVHVLRDGRDVVCSLRHHPKEKLVNGKRVPLNTNNPIPKCAERWLRDTATGLAYRGHPRYMEVRYEDLVADPESEVRRVCDFAGEEFSPSMLETGGDSGGMEGGRLINNANAAQPISSRSVGRWRKDLSAEERQQFVDITGELLIALGYVENHRWITEDPPRGRDA